MAAVEAVTSRATEPSAKSPDGAHAVQPEQPDMRLDELADIISAYNRVTENLQRSHESLRQQVARLQRELASTDAQLQRSKRLAALGEMAAGIAHEIRNPLAAISLYSRMLESDLAEARTKRNGDGDLLDDAADTAHRIGDVVRGLNGIVTDVLDFARELQPRSAVVDVRTLFTRAAEAQRPALDAARVSVRIDAGASMAIEVDADLLQQALVNLIRNAAEAMSHGDGREPRTLTLAARECDGAVVLTVRDTGPGIADDSIDRIFNPFFTTRNTGTGLGLAIVHRIVDAHGGEISVHNNGGAVFELSLPGRPPDPSSDAAGETVDTWQAECVL